ncbi:MAG: hypothetical protein EHM64_02015 [Ignavibacteriae bacterium]|nr:MAG: hypothetical protein EHM64_02015 [Ignavibacteriota bacterium]
METTTPKRSTGFSIFGIFLILLGAGLILSKLKLLHYQWGTILWVCLGIAGFAAAVQAFVSRRRGLAFWGSFLFFMSIAVLVHRFELLDFAPWDVPATFSLALGLSFLVLFLFEPRRFGVLVPMIFFCGYGILYYLWWWDVIDWFEMKHYVQTYWPALIILWGISLIFRPRRIKG